MKVMELNELPQLFTSGRLNEKQVIEEICRFVIHNYPVFGLQKYDDDFRQDVLLAIVERGHKMLHHYKSDFGEFFTFIYCFICTVINTKLKAQMVYALKEKINIEECIINLEEKEEKYHRIDFTSFEEPKAPYAPPKIPSSELQQTLKSLTLKHQDKTILVLALKSSYYLTDEQIQRICGIYGIKPEYFYNLIQHCKESLTVKSCRREKAEERRNFAYYHHKRYKKLVQKLDEDILPASINIKKERYAQMENKHRNNWNRLNHAFEKGHIYMRPTNKTVANLMGMCERQVNYYINCARREIEKEKRTFASKA